MPLKRVEEKETSPQNERKERKMAEKARQVEVRGDKVRREKVRRIRTWMLAGFTGIALFAVGINPSWFNLDRSRAVGFLQIGLWCFGLSLFLLSIYIIIRMRRAGRPNTLLSDVGVRLAATGLVLAVSASYADYLGIGSHALDLLSFGPLQVIGMSAGILVSLIGMALYWPWKKRPRRVREDLPEPVPFEASPAETDDN